MHSPSVRDIDLVKECMSQGCVVCVETDAEPRPVWVVVNTMNNINSARLVCIDRPRTVCATHLFFTTEDSFPCSHERYKSWRELDEMSWNFFLFSFTLNFALLNLLPYFSFLLLRGFSSLLFVSWCQIISGHNQSESAVWCRGGLGRTQGLHIVFPSLSKKKGTVNVCVCAC